MAATRGARRRNAARGACREGTTANRADATQRPWRSTSAPLISSRLLASLALAAPASAEVAHTVAPGETLWSIAAANNLTTRTVAAYNGLSEDAQVVLGSTIRVPTTVEGYAALQGAGLVAGRAGRRGRPPPPPPRRRGGARRRRAPTRCGRATRSPASPPAPASPMADMAAMNGLDPAGVLSPAP